jgi:XTP/dITP diphosphohydrolase
MAELIIATRNQGKLREYQQILVGLPLALRSLNDVGIDDDVDETGATFAENALLKARAYGALAGLAVLADDSGLEVAALDGAPGVHSHRFAGPDADDAARNTLLLEKLHGVPFHARLARFVCVIALRLPDGSEQTIEGSVPGVIEEQPKGTGGFGYDPLFFLLDEGMTMAELPAARKNQISHRAVAGQQARALLERWLAEGRL